MQPTLYKFQQLKENGSFDQYDSSLIQLLSHNNDNNKDKEYEWYFKNDDDEYECYGFDENIELETKYQSYLNGKKENEYFEIQSGYFSNCNDKHYIDFEQFNQYNYDQKERRKIIRTLNINEFNNDFLKIGSISKNRMNNKIYNSLKCIDDITKIKKREYCELQRNILSQVYNGGDAIKINISSLINNIINESLYNGGNKNDIPIASIQINKTNNYQQIDLLLNCFINYQYKIKNNISMNIIKLYNQCNIKLNSSIISYLISKEKINFILYDTDYQLLAIGKYDGSYIHQYDNNNNLINPYQYESFLEFHSLLTTFYELSLMQNLNDKDNKTGLQINSMISCFNKKIRSCLSYNNNYTLWTSSINKQEIFKQIININRVIKMENIIDVIYHNDDNEDNEDEDDEDENEIISNYDEALLSDSSNYDDENDYNSDYSQSSESSECIICCEIIDKDNNHCNHCNHCNDHKDIHHSCLLKWKQNGNDICPKCGI